MPYQALGSEGHRVRKTFCPWCPFTIKNPTNDKLGDGRCVCVCASPAACLFVWPELCSVLTACRGSQSPAVCRLPGSTEEMSVCLSLKGQSVNMTWSNNYYTFWQLCACVYLGICPPVLCNQRIFNRATSSLLWTRCSICWTRAPVCVVQDNATAALHW